VAPDVTTARTVDLVLWLASLRPAPRNDEPRNTLKSMKGLFELSFRSPPGIEIAIAAQQQDGGREPTVLRRGEHDRCGSRRSPGSTLEALKKGHERTHGRGSASRDDPVELVLPVGSPPLKRSAHIGQHRLNLRGGEAFDALGEAGPKLGTVHVDDAAPSEQERSKAECRC